MFLKRLFDLSTSLLGLICLFPLFLVIAILIKLRMPGRILFLQKRAGRYGNPFTICKFRTMIIKHGGSSISVMGENRITSLGKILRQTKIDELPQLFNVLKGDMSLVGPRPEVSEWTKVYPDKWAIVHSVKPGMTDNASIEFRNEEELLSKSSDPEFTYRNVILPRKLELYIGYVNNHTFIGDIKILFQTIKVVIFK